MFQDRTQKCTVLLSFMALCLSQDVLVTEVLAHVEATCDTKVKECPTLHCRFYCPVNCSRSIERSALSQETKPCKDAQKLFSGENAVDVIKNEDGSISLLASDDTTGKWRRNSPPTCAGDLELANDASICIITCALPDYECPPRRYKQRCACPWNAPILKDVDSGICVSRIRECPPFDTYVLPKSGLMAFKFIKQPVDLVKKRGDTIRMHCTVSGNTNYQYYWYKSQHLVMGSHSIIQSTDANLRQTGSPYYDINSIKPSDTGFYHCIVRTGDSVKSTNGKGAKYSLVSNTGYLRVEYIDVPDKTETLVITTQEKALQTELPCQLPKSEPPVSAIWYKGEEIVNDIRMFVVPETTDEGIERGSLYIMMADSEDAGMYTCKATYKGETYEVAKVKLQVTGFIGQPNSDPELVVEVAGRAKVRGTATFFCAGVGNPVPNVSWTREDGNAIETSGSMEVTDFNRKLVIPNVQPDMDRAFTCTVSSQGNRNPRKSLLYLSVLPSSYNINFVSTPESYSIEPNVYKPFTLQCAITVDPVVEAPVMYWLKNGASLDLKPPARILTDTIETIKNGTTIRNSTLTFRTPNESDQGVYQCIVENKEQMRQTTAYVDVVKLDVYDVYFPQEYFVSSDKKKRQEAADYCSKKWKPKGHLVTISNKNESETVFRMLVEKGITQSWIGLSTSENVWYSPGIWSWQVTNHLAKGFSYWYTDNPDNAAGNETSAIMDITKAGRWFDVGSDRTYSFVCSRYTARCPPIKEFYNKSAEPLLTVERDSTYYEVGQLLTVTCVGNKNGNIVKQEVKCLPSGTFDPPTLPCPVVSHAHHVTYSCLLPAAIFILLR